MTDSTLQLLLEQVRDAATGMREAQQRLEQYKAAIKPRSYPPEPPSNFIAFEASYPDTPHKRYEWAARRVNGRWYTTGHTCPQAGWTWEQLVDMLRNSMVRVSPIRQLSTDFTTALTTIQQPSTLTL